METTTIWIDSSNCRIFKLSPNGLIHHHLKQENQDPISRISYYRKILEKIENSNPILIVGPGIYKHRFQSHLIIQHPETAKKVIGCEHMSGKAPSEIALYARRFFKLMEPVLNLQ
jgi:stalled ribosome rescue protein Dom34